MKILFPFLALYKHHWLRISLSMFLAIIALLASIGLLTLSGWFLAASALAGLFSLALFNYMLPAAGVRGAAIIRTASRYAERLVSHDTTFRILSLLRVKSFTRLFPLSPAVIIRYKQADLLNRFVADIEILDHLYLRLLSPLLSALIVIAVVTLGISFISSKIAILLAIIMLAILLVFPWLFYALGNPIGKKITLLRSQYRSHLTSWLSGHAELTIFNAESRFYDRLNKTEQLLIKQQKQNASLVGISQALITLLSGITFILILWFAADGFNGNPPDALFALIVFAAISSFEALAPIGNAFQHLGQVMSSANRVKEILDQRPEVIFPKQNKMAMDITANKTIVLQLANIHFTYPGQPLPALHSISFTLKKGQHVALLGKTGCGKSTLLQLITRAWDPQQGEILLNDHPIMDYDEMTLRHMICVVSQRTYIFSATLRHNLLIGNEYASDNQLIDVLEKTGLSHLLDGKGLDNWIGEGGRLLSGGENRRIAIARAILHTAPIILMDEPTEGLDVTTERQILTLLRQQFQQKTVLTITHRLSGLDKMDNIIVMDGGTIIEQGNHHSLIQLKGRYYDFHQHIKL